MILKNKWLRAVLITTTLLVFSALQAETPRMVVVISVDGLTPADIETYAPVLSDRGLLSLTGAGAYTDAGRCRYMVSDAATHYASLLTGSTPRYHGIIADRFYSMVDDDIVSCTDDARYPGINTPLYASPRWLQATTIADQLKISYPESKVYAIALRAENGIMMGGHLADGVIWVDRESAALATSTYYNDGLPAWAGRLNSDSTIRRSCSEAWYARQSLKAYQFPPTEPYYGEDKPAFQKFRPNDETPVTMDKYLCTPMVNDLIKELAVRAIRDEQMGTDNAPDMLCVEFNARTGKNSAAFCAEKEDLLIRLDENIERLLEVIELSVGIDNSIIVLTAPPVHYSTPTPDDMKRINHGTFKSERSMALLNAYLMAIYGQGRWVTGYYNKQIYLNKRLIEDNHVRLNEICDHAAQFITEFSGVHSAMPAYQIQTAASMPYDIPSRMRNSHYKNRSGDVIFTLLPGWDEVTDDGERLCVPLTNPQVPIAIVAPGVDAGTDVEMDVEDVCPTLCRMLNLPQPNACVGNVVTLTK